MDRKHVFQIGSRRITSLQLAVHLSAWFLLALLAIQAATGDLSINPVQMAEQRTGKYAVYFLILTLACTPVNTIFGFRQAIKVRRPLGLYAFFFAAIHISIFVTLDYGLDFQLLLADVGNKTYILAGLITFMILTPLALTSSNWWKKTLRKTWKRLHQLVYISAVTALLHFAMARKGDLFGLQGNILEPVLLSIVVIGLLFVRIPPVRRRIVALREQIRKNRRLARGDSLPANGD